MSAWIVEKGHIDILVQALIAKGEIEMKDADATGQMLWHENHLSVNYRYGEDTLTPIYTFEGVEAPLDDRAVKLAVDCWDYQTCEHDGYQHSEARELVVNGLYPHVVDAERLRYGHPLYQWGYNDIRQAVAEGAPCPS